MSLFKRISLKCDICGNKVEKAVKREVDDLTVCHNCYKEDLDEKTDYCWCCHEVYEKEELIIANVNNKDKKLCVNCLQKLGLVEVCDKCKKLVYRKDMGSNHICKKCSIGKSSLFKSDNLKEEEIEDIYDDDEEDFVADTEEDTENLDIDLLNSVDLLKAEKLSRKIKENDLTPKAFLEKLDKYIIGQNDAKKKVSIALYNHLLSYINERTTIIDADLMKSNILLIGNSGTGKTLLAETLSKISKLPIVMTTITGVTEAGYSGRNIEELFEQLIHKCDYDVDLVNRGIVFIDEIDKIATRQDNANKKDINGEAVQNLLLRILEGTELNIPYMNGKDLNVMTINTKNILFICAGAFQGIDDIINSRISKKEIGFNVGKNSNSKEVKNIKSELNTKDLEAYGMKKEFLGRFSTLATLNDLKVEDLVYIMKNAKNSVIEKYQLLFKVQNKNLNFTDKALEIIAELSIKEDLGARGINRIISTVLNEVLFNLPTENIRNYEITEEFVINNYPNANKILNK